MLTELRMENWKSYEAATLFVDRLTALTGSNGSGKTNAIDALALLGRVASGCSITSALQGDGAQAALSGGLQWAARSPGAAFALGVVCRADAATDYEYRLACTIGEARCDVSEEYLARVKYRLGKNGVRRARTDRLSLFSTNACANDAATVRVHIYKERDDTRRQLGRAQCILAQLSGQELPQEVQDGVAEVLATLRGIFVLAPMASHMRESSPLSGQLNSDARNIAGVLAALAPEKQTANENVLTQYAGQLAESDIRRVFAERVGTFKSDAMLYCEEQWHDKSEPRVIDARAMSSGLLRFLATLTAMLTRPAGSLLVLDNIDSGLHPSRAGLLLDMLNTVAPLRGIDVLIATHSPALLNAMGTDMLPFITIAHRDASTGHSRLTLLEDLASLPKLLAQGPIGTISSQGLIEASLSGRPTKAFVPDLRQIAPDFARTRGRTTGDATTAAVNE